MAGNHQSARNCLKAERVSDLMRGKINLSGLDALVNMASAAGLKVEMRVLEVSDFRSQFRRANRVR